MDDYVLATVRMFGERARAERLVVVLDRGEEPAAMVEWLPGRPLAVSAGEETWEPEGDDGTPLTLEPPRAIPPAAIVLDPERAEVTAPIGAIEHLGSAVLALARALGGRTVAALDVPTASGTLTIAARDGDPVLVALGETQFALPGEP